MPGSRVARAAWLIVPVLALSAPLVVTSAPAAALGRPDAGVTPGASSNPFSNPGFETGAGDSPAPWTYTVMDAGLSGAPQTDWRSEGNRSYRFTAPGGNAGVSVISQTVDLTNVAEIVFDIRAHNSGCCNPPLVGLKVYVDSSASTIFDWSQNDPQDLVLADRVAPVPAALRTPGRAVQFEASMADHNVLNDGWLWVDNLRSTSAVAPPDVVVGAPNGGERWVAQSQRTVSWSASPGQYPLKNDSASLLLSTAGCSGPWTQIATGLPTSGGHAWDLPAATTPSACLRVTVDDDRSPANTGADVSDAVFEIAAAARPSVWVTRPNGGEVWGAGTPQTITWNATPGTFPLAASGVSVSLSIRGPNGPWSPVAAGIPNSGSLAWTVPNSTGPDAYVKVEAADDRPVPNLGADASDAAFTISALSPPLVAVTAPDGGENLSAGASFPVAWTASPGTYPLAADPVTISFSSSGLGGPWTVVASNLANSGSYAWTVPLSPTRSAAIKVEARDDRPTPNIGDDASDAVFTISQANDSAPKVSLLSPAPGALVRGASAVEWSGADMQSDTVYYAILISADSGATWSSLATATHKESPSPALRTVPFDSAAHADGTSYRIRVDADDRNGGLTSVSMGAGFSIDNSPPQASLEPSSRIAATLRPVARAKASDVVGLAEVAVEFRAAGVPDWKTAFREPQSGATGFDSLREVAIGEEGRFELRIGAVDLSGQETIVPGGEIVLDVTPPRATTDPRDGAEGVQLDLAVVFLFSEPVDPASVPANRVRVSAGRVAEVRWNGDEELQVALADLEGNRTYELTLMSGARDLAGNKMGEVRLRFTTIPIHGWLVGTVKDTASRPVAGAKVTLSSDSGTRETASGPLGEFRADGLEPGKWRLRVESRGYPAFETDVEIVAGKETQVEVLIGARPGPGPSALVVGGVATLAALLAVTAGLVLMRKPKCRKCGTRRRRGAACPSCGKSAGTKGHRMRAQAAAEPGGVETGAGSSVAGDQPVKPVPAILAAGGGTSGAVTRCPSCSADAKPGEEWCGACGQSLAARGGGTCGECGGTIDGGVCLGCGGSAPVRGDRAVRRDGVTGSVPDPPEPALNGTPPKPSPGAEHAAADPAGPPSCNGCGTSILEGSKWCDVCGERV